MIHPNERHRERQKQSGFIIATKKAPIGGKFHPTDPGALRLTSLNHQTKIPAPKKQKP